MRYKHIFLFLIFSFLISNSYAQVVTGPSIAWQRCYGTSGGDSFRDAKSTSDGGIITCINYGGYDGDAEGLYTLSYPAILIKFDPEFNIEWQSFFGGTNNFSFFRKVFQIVNDDYIAAGITSTLDGDFSDNHGGNDIMVVKTDDIGNKIWSKCYGSPGVDDFESFLPTKDGGYIITGRAAASGGDIPFHYGDGFGDDAVVIKTDSVGEILWVKVLGGSGDDGPLGDIVEIERGYYIINIGAKSEDYDLAESGISGDKRWILKMDSLGNIVDENFISGVNDLYTYTGVGITEYNDGIFVVGQGNSDSELYPTSPEHDSDEGAIAIFNSDLEFTYFKQWGGSEFDGFAKVEKDSAGNFYFLGVSSSTDYDLPGNYNAGEAVDYWLFAIDSNFNMLWSKNFGGSDDCGDLGCGSFTGDLLLKDNMLYAFIKNVVPDILPDYDIACGSLGAGNTDAWLVAFDLSTQIVSSLHSAEFSTVYPNPATGEIFVKPFIFENNKIVIELIDINGKRFFTSEYFQNEIIKINTQQFSKGMYLLIINNGQKNYQQKIVIQ